MSQINEGENHPSLKARIRRLPSWVRGGLVGSLLFILISLAFGIGFWVTDEEVLLAPLNGLFYLGVPPLLFVIIGALLGSGRKNRITLILVLVLLGLLSGICIIGLALGMLAISD